MGTRYYVAYGSNLNRLQMEQRCPGAKAVGTAVLKDYQLMYRLSKSGYYLTMDAKAGGSVPVAIWAVTAADEKKLDQYEGCPACYYKKELLVPVQLKDGGREDLACFVYLLPASRPLGLPIERYQEKCLQGYRDFGFDAQLLAAAYAASKPL